MCLYSSSKRVTCVFISRYFFAQFSADYNTQDNACLRMSSHGAVCCHALRSGLERSVTLECKTIIFNVGGKV